MKINTIITENEKRYAVTDTGARYVVQTNNKGEDFVYINNPNDADGLFTGRIGEAVDAVRQGEGDAVEVSTLFGCTIILVVYFLDRTVGAAYRAQSLEGWKDSVFKWIVTYGKKVAQSAYAPIDSKYDFVLRGFKKGGEPAVFDTKEDAERFYNALVDTVKVQVDKYQEEVKALDTAESRNVILQKYMDDLREEGRGMVIRHLFLDMLNPETLLTNDGYKFNEYEFAVEQQLCQ